MTYCLDEQKNIVTSLELGDEVYVPTIFGWYKCIVMDVKESYVKNKNVGCFLIKDDVGYYVSVLIDLSRIALCEF